MLGFGSCTKQSLAKSQGELAKCSQSNNINRNLLVKKIIMAKKVTSKAVASKASAALRDGRSSSRTKSIAASALSQREKNLNSATL